jgi:hypothetical protein
MPPTARPALTVPQILLGLFIVWQLVFLTAGNTTRYLPRVLPASAVPGALSALLSFGGAVIEGWTQLTGQRQEWGLFAPSPPTRAMFVSIELDGPSCKYAMASVFEPAEPGYHLHAPGSGDRLWHLEKDLAWPFVAWEADEVNQRPAEWHAYLEERLRANHQWRVYHSYLAWCLRKFREERPEEPVPQAVILQVHLFTPSAGKQRPAVQQTTVVLVRWRPEQQPPTGCLPLEMYQKGRWYFLPAQGKIACPL